MADGFLTRLDLFDVGRSYFVGRARKINRFEVDTEGSNANLFVGAASFMAYAVVQQLQDRLEAQFIGAAQGDDLTRKVIDVYDLPPKGAVAAITYATMWRTSASVGAGSVPVNTVVKTPGGIQYVTLEPANFGPTQLTAAPVLVRAVQAGKAFQVGANTIRLFDKPQLLFDNSLQINNEEAASGGEDPEDPDIYRERGRRFFPTARRGILSAIEYGALQTDGVVSAQAREVTNDGNPARLVELFIADSSGVANRALAARVRQTLLEYRGGGIQVVINTSRPVIVDVVLRLRFSTSVGDTSLLSQQVRNAVIEFINSLGVNEPLLRNDLGTVLSRFRDSGLIPWEGSVEVPTGDLYPEQSTTIRTRLENVSLAA